MTYVYQCKTTWKECRRKVNQKIWKCKVRINPSLELSYHISITNKRLNEEKEKMKSYFLLPVEQSISYLSKNTSKNDRWKTNWIFGQGKNNNLLQSTRIAKKANHDRKDILYFHQVLILIPERDKISNLWDKTKFDLIYENSQLTDICSRHKVSKRVAFSLEAMYTKRRGALKYMKVSQRDNVSYFIIKAIVIVLQGYSKITMGKSKGSPKSKILLTLHLLVPLTKS